MTIPLNNPDINNKEAVATFMKNIDKHYKGDRSYGDWHRARSDELQLQGIVGTKLREALPFNMDLWKTDKFFDGNIEAYLNAQNENDEKARGGFIDMQEGGDVENPFEGIEIGIDPPSQIPPDAFIDPETNFPIKERVWPDPIRIDPPPIGINPPDDDWGIEPPMPILPDPTEPDVFHEVLPDETVTTDTVYTSPRISQPIDKTQGFYALNPAPDETADQFAQRTTEVQPAVIPQPVDEGSWAPPEDYVSPRISTSFEDIFGYGGEGTSGIGIDTGTPIPKADPNTDKIKGVIEAVGVFSDAWTVYQIAQKEKWDKLRGATASPTDIGNYWSIDKVDMAALTPDDIKIFEGLQASDKKYFFDEAFRGKVDAWLTETNELRAQQIGVDFKPLTIEHGIAWMGYQDAVSDIRNMTGIVSPDSKFNVDWLKPDYDWIVKNSDYGILQEQVYQPGVTEIEVSTGLDWLVDKDGNKLLAVGNDTITLDAKINETEDNSPTTAEGWFNQLGKQTLFTSDDHAFNITLESIADDAFVGLTTAFLTGDAGKGAIAAAGSFTATDVVDGAVNKVWRAGIPEEFLNKFDSITAQEFSFDNAAKQVLNPEDYASLKSHTRNMNALMSSTATMLTSLALGGDWEDVIMDGAATAATVLGTEFVGTKILETFGQEAITQLAATGTGAAADAAMNKIMGVGGATIGAIITLIRTGDVKQAAISGLASGLLAAGNPWGWAVMGVQLLLGLGKQPSNKSGYASFDFDKFEVNKYSQGDYDIKKGKPENVQFSESLLQPLVPYLQELEATTGFDFKGDLQIHYSEAKDKGIYYTIGNRDQEGLSAKDMFLNRLDYYDGRDQSTQDGGRVYRRRFEANEQGIADMYEALMADLAYISENKITDLSYYTGVQKSSEEIQTEFGDFDFSTFRGVKRGGKISLDKGSNSQYNSKQYGFVNQKDKAPPSQRADDVPMDLKEGDFVLSQPAVALYGKDTVDRMLSRAATSAGTNLKSGGKVPVNVHNGEYVIPKELTKYIGTGVLNTMNDKGLMSVGERPNT